MEQHNSKYLLHRTSDLGTWELETPPGATSWLPPHEVAMILGSAPRITPQVAAELIGHSTMIDEGTWLVPTATLLPRLLDDALEGMLENEAATDTPVYKQLVAWLEANGARLMPSADGLPWLAFTDGSTITDQETLKAIYKAMGEISREADHAIVMAGFLAQDLVR